MSQSQSPEPSFTQTAEVQAFLRQAEETVRRHEVVRAQLDQERLEVRAEADRIRQQAEDDARRLVEAARQEKERLLEEAATELEERTTHLINQMGRRNSGADVIGLLRETQAEAIARAESAAMWQARAEMLAAELKAAREAIRMLQGGAPVSQSMLLGLASGAAANEASPAASPAEAVMAAQTAEPPRSQPEPPQAPPEAPPRADSEWAPSADDIAARLRAAIAGVTTPPPAPPPPAPPPPPSPGPPSSPPAQNATTAAPAPVAPPPVSRPAPAPAPAPPPPPDQPRVVRVLPPSHEEPVLDVDDQPTGHAAERQKPRRVLDRILGVLNGITRIVLVLCIVVLFGLLVPIVLGYSLLPVLGGSMEPTIPLGAVVAVKPVTPADIQVRDIITFSDRNNPGTLVTHRVVSLDTQTGRPVIKTKGDANQVEDVWDVPTDQPIQQVQFWIPLAGYVIVYLSGNQAKFVLAAIIVLLLVYQVVVGNRETRPGSDSEGVLQPRTA